MPISLSHTWANYDWSNVWIVLINLFEAFQLTHYGRFCMFAELRQLKMHLFYTKVLVCFKTISGDVQSLDSTYFFARRSSIESLEALIILSLNKWKRTVWYWRSIRKQLSCTIKWWCTFGLFWRLSMACNFMYML